MLTGCLNSIAGSQCKTKQGSRNLNVSFQNVLEGMECLTKPNHFVNVEQNVVFLS